MPRRPGVDGLIVVDLPLEEDEVLRVPAKAAGHRPDPLGDAHHRRCAAEAHPRPAPAAISIMSRSPASPAPRAVPEDEVRAALARIRAATDLPVAVGFGIRTPEQADAIARIADGVVVGSAIVSHGGGQI